MVFDAPRSTVSDSGPSVARGAEAQEVVVLSSKLLPAAHEPPRVELAFAAAIFSRAPPTSPGAAPSELGAAGAVRSGVLAVGTFDRELQTPASSLVLMAKW